MTYPEGYTAVVTGAASGVGAAVAARLAAEGVRVACLDRDDPTGTVEKIGNGAIGARLDITDASGCETTTADVIAAFGKIDALVNCAGIVGKTNITSDVADVADFELVLRINLTGALLISQPALRHMRERGYGRVLHIASVAGKEGNAGMAAYSASKAGLIGLVKCMGKEFAETGVTVNALAPAVIRTPMVAAMPEAQVKYMTDKIPMKRCGELDEAAAMVAWIVSPECSFTTGFTFDLTGGRAVY